MINQEIIKNLTATFAAKFGDSKNITISIAPGRVNLIGEHTDYNDGFVFPMTLDCALYVALRQRVDGGSSGANTCRVHALNFHEDAAWHLSGITKTKENYWSNYLKGVMQILLNAGYKLGGFDAVVYGDVPVGASLSSSAALEVATLCGLQRIFNLDIMSVDEVKLAQRAENEFVGMRCGIMDQFVSRLGKKGFALFLDCRSLVYKNVPFKVDGYSLLVVDSKVKRELVNSAYNERRASCEEAVRYCQKLYAHITALRDVDLHMLRECRSKTEMPDVAWRRACHVVSENQRVLDAMAHLEQKDMQGFGKLLYASHASLRDDYATSCAELDHIVEVAERGGALGARITGAGFGGCAVMLVRDQDVARLQDEIAHSYQQTFNTTPAFILVSDNIEATVL